MDKIDIKVKIESDKQKRIPINSFISVSEQIINLINEAGNVAGVDVNIEKWSVGDFRNGSVQYSVHGEVEDGQGDKYSDTINKTMSIVQPRKRVSEQIPYNLYNTFLGIADKIPFDGRIKLSVYSSNGKKKQRAQWHVLSQEKVRLARERLNQEYTVSQISEIQYIGEIKGIVYSWQKEGRKPQIEIQEFTTGERIKCFYDENKYDEIYSILDNKNNTVYVTGMIVMDKKTNKINSIKAIKLSVDRSKGFYKEGDLDRFFGCAPNITGGLSPREYIDKVRDDGE